MRVALHCLALSTAGCRPPVADQPVVPAPPRHPMVVRCFLGGIDSGASGSFQTNLAMYSPPFAVARTSGRFGESGGPAAEVEWVFLGRRGPADLYRVQFRFPAGEPGCKVLSAEVPFAGERVRVFEDGPHCVVLDPGGPLLPPAAVSPPTATAPRRR